MSPTESVEERERNDPTPGSRRAFHPSAAGARCLCKTLDQARRHLRAVHEGQLRVRTTGFGHRRLSQGRVSRLSPSSRLPVRPGWAVGGREGLKAPTAQPAGKAAGALAMGRVLSGINFTSFCLGVLSAPFAHRLCRSHITKTLGVITY